MMNCHQPWTKHLKDGLIRQLDDQHYWAAESWAQTAHAAATELRIYHHENPLRLGMLRAELQSRLKVKLTLLDALIENETS